MLRRVTLFLLFSLIFGCLSTENIPKTQGGSQDSPNISTHGVIMGDILPEPKLYYGFAISQTSFGAGLYASEDWRYIKSLGFDTIIARFHWADEFEPKAHDSGKYDTTAIANWKKYVKLAQDEGFNVVLGGWLAYNPTYVSEDHWQGWSDNDYVILNRTYSGPYLGLNYGLDRYVAFWEMMARNFPNCMYCFNYYPYHQQSVDNTREDAYNNVVIPALINAVRKYNNNKIWFVPIHQRPYRYLDSDFDISIYVDPNIVWCDGHALFNELIDPDGVWDYDYAEIDAYYDGLRYIRQQKPSASICSVEYAGLKFYKTPPYTVHPSRLDALEYSNNIRRTLKLGYCYHWVSIASSHLNSVDNLVIGTNPLELHPEILDILVDGIGF